MDIVPVVAIICIYILIGSDGTCISGGSFKTEFTTIAESVVLQSGGIPGPTIRVIWEYANASGDTIIEHNIGSDPIYANGHSLDKYKYNTTDYSLTITGITQQDITCYRWTCVNIFGKDIYHMKHYVQIKLAVSPSSIVLMNTSAVFHEYTPAKVVYQVSSVNPGKGYITFTVNVGGVAVANSTENELTESYISNRSVSVIYSPLITLQKQHNFKAMICKIVWRTNTELESTWKNVEVKFGPTKLSLTTTHSGLVSVGTVVALTCVTDEGNPTPTIVWTQNGQPIQPQPSGGEIQGQYNAQMRQSVLRIIAQKDLNGTKYKCEVGASVQTYMLKVKLTPDLPYDVQFPVVTAHTVTVAWISGHSGGSTQTFQIHYKEASAKTFNIISSIPDPGVGSRVQYEVANLKEVTTYAFKITSENGILKGKNTAESALFVHHTLAVPKVTGSLYVILTKDNSAATFMWPVIEGIYTKIIIQKCIKDSPDSCAMLTGITNSTASKVTVKLNDPQSFHYTLNIYQYTEKVHTYQFDWLDDKNTLSQTSGALNYGVVLGPIVAVLIILLIVAVAVIVALQRKEKTINERKGNSKPQGQQTYENVLELTPSSTKVYESPDPPTEPLPTPIYAALQTYEDVNCTAR